MKRIGTLLLTAVLTFSFCFGNLSTALASESSVIESIETYGDTEETETTSSNVESEPESQTSSENNGQTETTPESESESIKPLETEAISESSEAQTENIENAENMQVNVLTADSRNSDNVQAFVARLYTLVLDRTGEDDGVQYWSEKLLNGTSTGADIIYGFVFSEEFKKRNLSNEDYVEVLYNAIFDRSSDTEGKEYWLGFLESGMTRYYVCAGFANSVEFKNLCSRYQINPGGLKLTSYADCNPDTTQFVARLYTQLLQRQPEESGVEYHVWRLVTNQCSAAEAVSDFAFSDELTQKNISDTDFVERLYRTILGRPSGGTECSGWVSLISQGMSRSYILNQFICSQEFANLCVTYNVRPGSITLTEDRDQNRDVTLFISAAFSNCFGRTASVSDLNSWAERINSRQYSANSFLSTLIFSTEGKNHTRTDEDFVKVLFRTALQREASSSEVSHWVSQISKSSREAVFVSITTSKEFIQLCEDLNINFSAPDGWFSYDNNWYYYENGVPVSGWKRINNQMYYFNPSDNNRRATGWHYIDGLKYYFNSDGTLNQNVDSIIGRQSSYQVKVNTTLNVVTVFAKDGANGYIIPVKNMICSTGVAATPTVKGTFTIQRLGTWWTLMGPVYGQYVSRIYGGYLFHSAWYHVNGNKRTLSVSEYRKLGTNASHGCVRLTVADAKWIYDNCNGSQVTVYSSSSMSTKFDKPVRPDPVVISGDYGYDPTDPAFN